MTTTTSADLDLLRARMTAAIGGRMAGHLKRLDWGPTHLAHLQRARLRALLARAIDRSPFHAARLAGIDAARFELADLAQLPIMTKAQMMGRFGEIVTDRRLTRDRVDRHLAASEAEPALLLATMCAWCRGAAPACAASSSRPPRSTPSSSPRSTAGRWPRSWAAEVTRPMAR